LLNTPPKPPTTPLPALLLHQRKHVVKSELLVASGFPGGPRGGGGQSVSSSSRRGTPRASGGGATCSLLRRGSGGRCPTALLVQPQFARKEKARFYRMARRSATECAAILDVVNELELPPDRNSARGANTCRPSLPCSGNSLPQALSPRELDSSPPLICNLQCYALTKPPRSGLDHMERPAHDRNVVGIANGITMQPSTVGPVVVDCGGGAGAPLGPASFACTVTGSWWLDTDDPANAALVTRPVPPLVVTLSGGELSPGAVGAPVDISMTVQLMKK
jgi:hypothetical protein